MGLGGFLVGGCVLAYTGFTVPLAIAGAVAGGLAGGAMGLINSDSHYLENSVKESLGVQFEPAGEGRFRVASVAPHSLGEAGGLARGDVMAKSALFAAPETPAEMADQLAYELALGNDLGTSVPIERAGERQQLRFPPLTRPA